MDYEALRHTHLVAHSRIDRTLEALTEAARSGDADAIPPLFERLRIQIVMHMDSEDRAVLPSYAEADPEDAQIVRQQHLDLRQAIRELGDHVRERSTSADDVARFRARFSLHEAHEETGMYRWYAARHGGPFEHEALPEG